MHCKEWARPNLYRDSQSGKIQKCAPIYLSRISAVSRDIHYRSPLKTATAISFHVVPGATAFLMGIGQPTYLLESKTSTLRSFFLGGICLVSKNLFHAVVLFLLTLAPESLVAVSCSFVSGDQWSKFPVSRLSSSWQWISSCAHSSCLFSLPYHLCSWKYNDTHGLHCAQPWRTP